jgi:hypothetical protein
MTHAADVALRGGANSATPPFKVSFAGWRALDRAHVSVARVEEDAEVRVFHFPDELRYLGRLVEEETRLELPDDLHLVLLGDSRARPPEADDALPRGRTIDARRAVRRAHGVDANAGRPEVEAELQVLLEQLDVVVVLLGRIGRGPLVAPEVRGEAADPKAVFLDQVLHAATIDVHGVVVGVDVRLEGADLDAVVLQLAELLDDGVEGYRVVLVGPEGIRPGPDGEQLRHARFSSNESLVMQSFTRRAAVLVRPAMHSTSGADRCALWANA